MEQILLIVDTSVLKKHSSLATKEIELLAELSRINAIRFRIPEMVEKEFLSQKIVEIVKPYDCIITALKQLQKKTLLNDIQIDNELIKFKDAKNRELCTVENEWIEYKRKKNISIIKFSTTTTNKVFKDYIEGNPPFKEIKNRNDIPDSFVFHSILSLTNLNSIYFICDDKKLREAVSNINVKTYGTISEFLELSEVRIKLKELEDLSSVKNELQIIKDNEDSLNKWVFTHIKKSIPIEVYNVSATQTERKDKIINLHEIKSIALDYNKARLFNSNILVIPLSINAIIDLEVIYNKDEAFKNANSSNDLYKLVIEFWKQKSNETGFILQEKVDVDLELSINFDVVKPFDFREEKVSYSDISKQFLLTDFLNRSK